MRSLLLLLSLLLSFFAQGQDYRCIIPAKRQYFNNNDGYLRAIRVDSLRSYPDSTVYFPFHTVRTPPGITGRDTGGCWIGSKVVEKSDSVFFETMWGNNLLVRSQAAVADSWILYEDTSPVYYEAYLSSIEPRTIDGFPDTIKIVTIKAYNRYTGFIPSDPANNLRISISERHGLYEAFDFFLFPHRLVIPSLGSSGYPVSDYYFRHCGSQQFHSVTINRETNRDLYNYNIGDVIYYSTYCAPLAYGSIDTRVKVITKDTSNPYDFVYTTIGKRKSNCGIDPTLYTVSDAGGVIHADTTLINFVDTLGKMPEEVGMESILYYKEDDSSYCLKSPSYRIRTGSVLNEFEYCEFGKTIKMGVGTTEDTHCFYVPGDFPINYGSTQSVSKVGTPCYVGIQSPNSPADGDGYNLIPNPARDIVTLQVKAATSGDISIADFSGHTLLHQPFTGREANIQVNNLVPGVYIVIITDKYGSRVVRKLAISN